MKYYQLNCPAHTPIKLLFDQSSGSSKYGTICKNTQKYYKPKRLIRCIYCFFRGHGNESCNLIGSLPGQYFPISAHGPR